MKKLFFAVLCVTLPLITFAQQQVPDYIKKGDEAMLRQDYPDAKMWYEEGVSFCDLYCIEQITDLWLEHERMHTSMRSLMSRCLNCLNNMALEEDTIAIKLLEVYYREGIGTTPNEELANYWVEKLYYLQHPDEYISGQTANVKVKPLKDPMQFFVGYAYSIEAPYGISIGGVAGRLGWYARFKTNASFNNNDNTCNDAQLLELPSGASYEFTGRKKINSYVATAGVVIKCLPWLYTSFGFGYGSRELLWEYDTYSYTDQKKQEVHWAKNTESSYNGVAAEIDILVKVAGPLYISAGCNTVNFKYVDLNAGIGVFF